MKRFLTTLALTLALVVPAFATTFQVQAGPHVCAGGSNNGTECCTNGECTGGGTCTGTGNLTFRDCTSGTTTSNITAGDTIDFVYTTNSHDIAGGEICVGGLRHLGACDSGATPPDRDCHTCTGGSNDGVICVSNVQCTGGGTCDTSTGTCEQRLADSFDGGAHSAPFTFSYTFTIAG